MRIQKGQLLFDETGKQFKDWYVIRHTENQNGTVMYLCRCRCGKEKPIAGSRLRNGGATNCGCRRKRTAAGVVASNNLYKTYRIAAKNRGFEFNLSKELFLKLVKQNCRYCGVPPKQVKKIQSTGDHFIYNGLDRLNNKCGYTLDNVAACCYICNQAKHAMTEEAFMEWIVRLVKNFFPPPSDSDPYNLIDAYQKTWPQAVV